MSSLPSSPASVAPGPQRILLLQLKRIGDFILTAPAVAALRARHPQAEIVAVVPDSMTDLSGCMPGLDRVLSYRGARPNLAVWSSLLIGEWDACYDFTGTDRSALMAWISRAKERHGYARFVSGRWKAMAYTRLCPASVRELHTVDFHLALTAETSPETSLPAVLELRADQVFKVPAMTAAETVGPNYAVVHIGTAREEKFWPPQRWLAVVAHLIEQRQLRVFLTGTNTGIERPHLDQLRSLLAAKGYAASRDAADGTKVLDLTGSLSLVETAQVIAASSMAMGVDSMAMHLAAMLGKPEIVLFGPTNPYHWRPRHENAIVLAAGHPGAMAKYLPKAKGAPMELISEEQVINAVDQVLQNYRVQK